MSKTASIIISAVVLGSGLIFFGALLSKNGGPGDGDVQNIEIKDGVQYITVDAKGGYWPKVSEAQAGIPTKLVIKTNGTYDCSAALVIRSIGFKKVLAQRGEEIIDLGVPKAGEPLRGVCSMGMYSFQVQFN